MTATASWGVSQLLGNESLPEVPSDVLPEWLRNMVDGLAEQHQVAPALPAMVALSILGAACGGRVFISPKRNWVEPTNVYTAVALPPGEGKTPPFTALAAPVYEVERALQAEQAGGISSAVSRKEVAERRAKFALDAAVKANGDERAAADFDAAEARAEADAVVVPPKPRLISVDATPEALATLISHHSRMALLSDEGGIFGQMLGRYTGTSNLDVYLKGHTGGWLSTDRVTRQEEATEAFLTIGLAIQPSVLQALGESKELRGRGLVARFLFAWPESRVGSRDLVAAAPIDDAVLERYRETMAALLRRFVSAESKITLELTDEAASVFQTWQRKVERELGPAGSLADIADWGAKLPGQTARLAALLHVAATPAGELGLIEASTVEAAVRFAEALVPHMLAVVNLMGESDTERRGRALVRWLKRKQQTEFKQSDAYRDNRAHFDNVDQVGEALRHLADRNWVEQIEEEKRGPKGGRPSSPRWRVRANLWVIDEPADEVATEAA